jgi:hypothetical protein
MAVANGDLSRKITVMCGEILELKHHQYNGGSANAFAGEVTRVARGRHRRQAGRQADVKGGVLEGPYRLGELDGE